MLLSSCQSLSVSLGVCFRLLNDPSESRRVVQSDIRKYLSVQLHLGFAHHRNQIAVADAIETSCCIDSCDPKSTKLSLLVSSISVSVGQRVEQLLFRSAEGCTSTLSIPFGGFKNFLMSIVGNLPASCPWHDSLSFSTTKFRRVSRTRRSQPPYGSICLADFTSAVAKSVPFRRCRFRLVVIFVRIWLRYALRRLTFPEPVKLNRFAAARFVFIFGITSPAFYQIVGSHGRL